MPSILMSYSPAAAALVARLSLREGIKDVSFRFRGKWMAQASLLAWFWPVICGGVVYGASWAFGLTRFELSSVGYPFYKWGPENVLGIGTRNMTPPMGFMVRLIACLVFSLVLCVGTLGEELGWRGYMLTRLFDAKIPAPIFCNGLMWGLWHIPFIVFASSTPHQESQWISGSFFVAGTIAGAYLLGYLRLRSGSIWPAVLAHASGNAIFGLALDAFTNGNPFWKGELRLLSMALPVVMLLSLRVLWTVHYWPDTPRQSISQEAV
jgi:CAAX protease family protein